MLAGGILISTKLLNGFKHETNTYAFESTLK